MPSYRGGAPSNARSVQKSASFEAETNRTTRHATGATPAANNEKPAVAPFKQAASEHRMRRLRQWSLTHGQDATGGPTEGEGSQQDVEAALTEIQRTNTAEATTSSNGTIEASSSLKDKAWSIMAGLSLETLDKKRGVAAVEPATAGVASSTALARGPIPTGSSDRRKTEPLNASQNVARKPVRGPSDGEREKERQLENGGTKRQKSSLVGRPRTRIGVK